MNLSQLKQREMNSRHQIVHFDRDGVVRASCQSLFDLMLDQDNIFGMFPILEAVRATLLRIAPMDKSLVYPVVEHHVGEHVFMLDLRLSAWPKDPARGFLLMIQDQSDVYRSILHMKERAEDLDEKEASRPLRVVR